MTITDVVEDKKDYWNERAKRFGTVEKGLKAVCSYGMPRIYNSYIDLIQRKGISSVLDVKVNESILDLGCGVGRWSLEMARKGAKVTGVDISEEMIAIARTNTAKKEVPASFIVSPIAGLRLKKASFDKVTAVTVLQHILSERELNESAAVISSALKPCGTFIMLEVAPGISFNRCDTDIFTARTSDFYENLFARHGLELKEVRAVDPSPFKRWLLPHYKKLPWGLKGIFIAVVSLLSLLTDYLLAGTKHLLPYSWHKVMIFKKYE